MYFIWHNWQCMNLLRHDWFRSPQYQSKVYSRTLMVTQVPKEYRSDEGLVHLMQQLKVDGIKISHDIECATIGRRLDDFPDLVDAHNEAVKDLEKVLVRYLKHGKEARKRPTVRKGGFMCCGGRKVDAIDYYAKQIKFLRDQVDDRRAKVHSLIKQERKARKGGKSMRLEGEDYGFVTFKTVAEAHRIARAHDGKLRELDGACLQMAPAPRDILWKNIKKDPVDLASANMGGWVLLAAVFIGYAVPTLIVSVLANMDAFSEIPQLHFLKDWHKAESWSYGLVSSTLGPALQALFALVLPIIIRRICKRQGAPTRSRLDRATTARYYFITTVWMLFFLTLFGTVYQVVLELIDGVNKHESFDTILAKLALPESKLLVTARFTNSSQRFARRMLARVATGSPGCPFAVFSSFTISFSSSGWHSSRSAASCSTTPRAIFASSPSRTCSSTTPLVSTCCLLQLSPWCMLRSPPSLYLVPRW
jgi:hypothetical protein